MNVVRIYEHGEISKLIYDDIAEPDCKSKKIVSMLNSILYKKKKITFQNIYYQKNTSKKIFYGIKNILKKNYTLNKFYDVKY